MERTETRKLRSRTITGRLSMAKRGNMTSWEITLGQEANLSKKYPRDRELIPVETPPG